MKSYYLLIIIFSDACSFSRATAAASASILCPAGAAGVSFLTLVSDIAFSKPWILYKYTFYF
jgi:hypothetical protein